MKKIRAIVILIFATVLFFSTLHPLIYWHGVFSKLTSNILSDVRVLKDGKYDAKNNHHWVLIFGRVEPLDSVEDKAFGIKLNRLFIERRVDIYQWTRGDWYWKEGETSKYKSKIFTSTYKLGEFTFSSQFHTYLKKSYKRENLSSFPSKINGFVNSGTTLYRGYDRKEPKEGDVLIDFISAPIANYTILGIQEGETIRPYTDSDGDILFVVKGEFSPIEIIEKKFKQNHLGGSFIGYLFFTSIFTLIGFITFREPLNISKALISTISYLTFLFLISWIILL